jgi:hypothetical protein
MTSIVSKGLNAATAGHDMQCMFIMMLATMSLEAMADGRGQKLAEYSGTRMSCSRRLTPGKERTTLVYEYADVDGQTLSCWIDCEGIISDENINHTLKCIPFIDKSKMSDGVPRDTGHVRICFRKLQQSGYGYLSIKISFAGVYDGEFSVLLRALNERNWPVIIRILESISNSQGESCFVEDSWKSQQP